MGPLEFFRSGQLLAKLPGQLGLFLLALPVLTLPALSWNRSHSSSSHRSPWSTASHSRLQLADQL
ncbi:hypothetical protein IV58_GL001445 [Lactobacillus delbrueckii subsp. jakobsenii ZN7a-9 = DSM 26046]|nr:hypothetical protein IV58_GL001445 [Lactobacillus delbrueckii subsp. jakobsenii ZN7a-9 = DSM 26046]